MAIRPANLSDIPTMLEIYRPFVENTTVSFEYTVPTQAEFIQRFRAHRGMPWLVWEENRQVLGYAYAGLPWSRAAYRWCAESSVYLAPQAQGRGIGRQLMTTLEEDLARLGYRRLYAVVTGENQASIAFHQALGFVPRAEFPQCGWKFGRWLSVVWLEKTLASGGCPQAFPQTW